MVGCVGISFGGSYSMVHLQMWSWSIHVLGGYMRSTIAGAVHYFSKAVFFRRMDGWMGCYPSSFLANKIRVNPPKLRALEITKEKKDVSQFLLIRRIENHKRWRILQCILNLRLSCQSLILSILLFLSLILSIPPNKHTHNKSLTLEISI